MLSFNYAFMIVDAVIVAIALANADSGSGNFWAFSRFLTFKMYRDVRLIRLIKVR